LWRRPRPKLGCGAKERRRTPWSRALLEKITVTQPVKKFHALYGTRRFISIFKTACH
jgi:hypothetical protein